MTSEASYSRITNLNLINIDNKLIKGSIKFKFDRLDQEDFDKTFYVTKGNKRILSG